MGATNSKFRLFLDFGSRTTFHTCTNHKKSQRKIFISNKDAKTCHFHCFPEKQAGSARTIKVECCIGTVLEEITDYKGHYINSDYFS